MNEPIRSWPEALAEAILSGTPNEIVRVHLDALIRWLSGASSPDANAIDQALIKKDMEPGNAGNLALALLERVLFADGADAFAQLGLAFNATEAEIRARYKRLVRVFHPDRQLGESDWLHDCTQKLNLAHEEALKLTQAPAASTTPSDAKSPDAAKGRYGTRYAGPSKRDQVRAKLGTAQALQRKAFVILGGIALFSVFYLWMSMPKFSDAGNKATAIQSEKKPQGEGAPKQHPATQPQMNLDLQSQPQAQPSTTPEQRQSEALLKEIKEAEQQRLIQIKHLEEEKRLAERVDQEQKALALALAQQKAELDAEKKRLEEESRRLTAEIEARRKAELKRQQEEAARIAEAKRHEEEKQRAAQKQKEQKALELALAQQQAAERAAKEAEEKRKAKLKRQQEEAKRIAQAKRLEEEKRLKAQKQKEQEALALALAQQQAEKEAAKEHARQQAEKKRLTDEAMRLLKDYVRLYNAGDLEGFMTLFSKESRMNNTKGRAAIRKAYEKFFAESTDRDMQMTVLAIEPSGRGAHVEVSYVLTYVNSSSSNERLEGEINLELTAGEEGSKIMSQRF